MNVPETEREEEKKWVCDIRKEDKKAFKAVYDRYADKVYYLSLKFHLTEEEAKEMVQSVFLTLWEKRAHLQEHLSLNAFLLTITKNRILNLHKRKAVEIAGVRTYLRLRDEACTTTEDYVLFSNMEEHTLRFIDSLPPRNRQIFLLSRKEGLDSDTIARQLNLSKRTVENNIYQAETAIRHFLSRNKVLEKSILFFIAWMGL
ncbi:sigma-70 family RNA polymerase sigma factor [Porifericola rhodea]|uniref:sigma-70 family RNA polymerase sigma factor n=1 Tax=Porifericola rhodea TaxID=930972 RepID=UPI00266598EA|nr:sigma-70 family RNA polymerase sigma factor [Porifericola rhodea]WKN29584.1 sigma-70 family RNA polymerase sigma factor [Porifericola rhodea]